MEKVVNRKKFIAGVIVFCGITLAAGVLLFPNIPGALPARAGENPQWVQNTGAGISVPACASASLSMTCVGSQPQVTFNISGDDNYDGLEKLYINYPNVIYYANN